MSQDELLNEACLYCDCVYMDFNILVMSIIQVLINLGAVFTCTQRNMDLNIPVYIILVCRFLITTSYLHRYL